MDLNRIGNFIAFKRKEKKLTQEELAELLAVNNRTISRWENGKNMPDISLYKPLCEILDISIEELINGEVNAKNKKECFEKALINTSDIYIKTKKKLSKQVKILIILFFILLMFSIFIIIYYNRNYRNKYPKFDIYNMNVVFSKDNFFNEDATFFIDGYRILFYGIDSLQLIDNELNYYDLKVALNHEQVSIDDIKKHLDFQAKNSNIEMNIAFDGGTKKYVTKKYEIVFCNNINGNNDIYIGTPGFIDNLNGNYCGNDIIKVCYFTRTYYINNIAESDDVDFLLVTLQNKFEKQTVKINKTANIQVGKSYEFIFSTEDKFKDCIIEIFKNSYLIDVALAEEQVDYDKQINEDICINNYK